MVAIGFVASKPDLLSKGDPKMDKRNATVILAIAVLLATIAVADSVSKMELANTNYPASISSPN